MYYNDKKATQDIKKFLKPHTVNKLSDPKDKKLAIQPEKKQPLKKVLPIRGQDI